MKKLTVGLLVLIMTLCLVLDLSWARTGSRRSTIRVYGTTGGAAGDLDAIECEDIRGDDAATTDPLRDDDVAWGIITTAGAHPQIYFWAFDEDAHWSNCTAANEPWDFCGGAGAHDSGTHATIMTDSGEAFPVDGLIGMTIYNTTDTGASGTVTDNDATTVTVASLSGGTNNEWQSADTYVIADFTEDDPRLILPDDIADCTVTANEGAWVLGETYYLGRVATPSVVFRDADAADTDDNAYWQVNCTDTGSGTEDCDATLYVQIAGTATAVITVDADGSITLGLPPVLGTITSGVGTALTALDGENIQNDTIDDDSIDFTDVTLLDFGLAATHDTDTELDALYEAELNNSAGLLAALSDETGTGVAVFSTSPTLVTPVLGTITSGVGTALTALDGEQLQNDTVDDDSIDFTDVTALDITHTGMTNAIATTGLLSGGVITTSKSANYTVGTDSAAECYGGVVYVTSTCDITACDNLAAGMSFSVITIGATQVDLDVQADDLMVLDGTTLDDGDKAVNTSTAGDIIVCTYYDATGWYCSSNSWTDGG